MVAGSNPLSHIRLNPVPSAEQSAGFPSGKSQNLGTRQETRQETSVGLPRLTGRSSFPRLPFRVVFAESRLPSLAFQPTEHEARILDLVQAFYTSNLRLRCRFSRAVFARPDTRRSSASAAVSCLPSFFVLGLAVLHVLQRFLNLFPI